MWTAVRQRRLCGQCLLTVASLAHQGYATDPCGESFIMYDDAGRAIDFSIGRWGCVTMPHTMRASAGQQRKDKLDAGPIADTPSLPYVSQPCHPSLLLSRPGMRLISCPIDNTHLPHGAENTQNQLLIYAEVTGNVAVKAMVTRHNQHRHYYRHSDWKDLA
ncbi:hypothetical protein EDB83DRAFT_2433495 [Lactarius deliciosus]|nr:hypothetical protein EDB83DRAFT_2433495 [Lactarius deliciosus]